MRKGTLVIFTLPGVPYYVPGRIFDQNMSKYLIVTEDSCGKIKVINQPKLAMGALIFDISIAFPQAI